MAVQNLVSASITPEAQDAIVKSIADIRARLGFLLNLQAADIATMVKAGKEFVPFLAECRKVVKSHPEIFTGSFDPEEFERDFQLVEALGPISDDIEQLAEAVRQTLMAARSDALVGCLDIYGATQYHKDKVAGLNVVADNLAVYFKRGPRASAKAPK